MRNNQKGFSLPEAMIGIFLLGVVGVAGMRLSHTMKDSSTIIKTSDALSQTMVEIRTMLRNPTICTDTFKDAIVGSTVTKIKDLTGAAATSGTTGSEGSEGENSAPVNVTGRVATHTKENPEGFEVEKPVANGKYVLKRMEITKLDVDKNRAYAIFTFDKKDNDQSKAVTRVNKVVSLFVDTDGTKINNCIDPVDLASDFILDKLCYEADPVNFDADLMNNDPTNCANNIDHIVEDMKKIYCSDHPRFKYVNGKCVGILAEVDCGPGAYLKGFDVLGGKICYTPTPMPAPAAPPAPCNPATSPWTPLDSASNVCSTVAVQERSNCDGSIRDSSTMGTKTCSTTAPGCSASPRNWGSACLGDLPAADDGVARTVSNTNPAYDGQATYTCNAGNWDGPTSPTCLQRCPSQTVTWPASPICSAPIAEGPSGSTVVAVYNTATGYTGSANFICNNGTWTLQSGETCAIDGGGGTWGGGSGGCFIAGSKVRMADGSEKNIEDILKGDLIKTFNEAEAILTVNSVEEPLYHAKELQELYTYVFSNGRSFVVTGNHPLWVPNIGRWMPAWVVAQGWFRGENPRLLDAYKNEVTIKYVGKRLEEVEVYNMHVENDHTYFVSDILVHNGYNNLVKVK